MLTVITGGARSGKSTMAERLAARTLLPVTVIATAEARDDDMAHGSPPTRP
jgi:adenosylcobinamide kinase/adenosylcobinamide-phosphate guanylyltransferase